MSAAGSNEGCGTDLLTLLRTVEVWGRLAHAGRLVAKNYCPGGRQKKDGGGAVKAKPFEVHH